MTIAERVRSIVDSQVDLTDEVPAGIEKMIYMAYYMGRTALHQCTLSRPACSAEVRLPCQVLISPLSASILRKTLCRNMGMTHPESPL